MVALNYINASDKVRYREDWTSLEEFNFMAYTWPDLVSEGNTVCPIISTLITTLHGSLRWRYEHDLFSAYIKLFDCEFWY